MARSGKSPGNKKTSFGKRTGAEKSFRENKKTRSGRGERSDKPFGDKRFSSAGKSSSSRFGGDKPRGEGRPSFGAKSRTDRPFDKKREGTGFKRDNDGAPRENRFSRPTNFSKPRFDKPSGERSFGKTEGDRPFKSKRPGTGFKRDSEGGAPRENRFSRPGNFSKPRFENDKPRGEGSFRESGRPKPFTRKRDDERSQPSSDRRFARKDDKFSTPRTDRSADGEKKFSKPFEKRKEGADRFSKFRKDSGEKPEKDFVKKEFKKPFPSAEPRSFSSRKTERPVKTETTSPATEKSEDGLIRLNKFMANSGVGSRRESDEYIKMGLVTVNGETITEMGHKVKPTDDIRYEGRKLKAEPLVYILLNKPKGFITTSDDPEERKTVMDLVANACKERIYPVGRLDRNTTGLLLFTNDGDLADKLTHPSYNAKKIYKVELDRPLTKNDFQKILDGVYLEEGRVIVDDLAIVSDDGKEVGIEIHIGWNRIVRRVFEALGYQIVKLDRVVYAGLDKKDLARGQWRFLKPEEVVRLKHFQG
jgi:23S rRNA pseudouridine2605 synthase